MTRQQMYEFILLAICNWREAQNQPDIAKRGQAWTVRNRVLHPNWWGRDWVSVILMPLQFSSFNRTNPNAVKLPFPGAPEWGVCLQIAGEVYAGQGEDPTQGSTHYFDKSLDQHPPKWATDGSMLHVTDLGDFHFYRTA